MNLGMKKSKKGITLVESVLAVVILGIFATGLLSLLTTGGTKIQQISHEASAYTEATQKLDMFISAISNGSDEYIFVDEETPTVYLDVTKLKDKLDLGSAKIMNIGGVEVNQIVPDLYPGCTEYTVSNVRGWYLKLSYNGVIVSGFASNSGGVFDK